MEERGRPDLTGLLPDFQPDLPMGQKSAQAVHDYLQGVDQDYPHEHLQNAGPAVNHNADSGRYFEGYEPNEVDELMSEFERLQKEQEVVDIFTLQEAHEKFPTTPTATPTPTAYCSPNKEARLEGFLLRL